MYIHRKNIINSNTFSHTLVKTKITNGSPICNEKCEVIGINTSPDAINKYSHSGNFIGEIVNYLDEQIINKLKLE